MLLDDYPVFTAAFWSYGEALVAAEPWTEVMVHGGNALLRRQLMDSDRALTEWQEYYSLSPPLVSLARSLYARRVVDPTATVVMEPQEVRTLQAFSSLARRDLRAVFSEMGIILP
jgi:hypothetical protein